MPESSPRVSVVIPTYNHAPMLREALRSVQAQTFSDWEAVVVNNFSEDDTVEVVQSFGDPRIRLLNFRNHGVIAASRNEGIRHARGSCLAFLDSDDQWYPEKLERCLNRLDNGDAELVCHAEQWLRGDVPIRNVTYGPAERAGYRELLFTGNALSTSAVVVRRDAVLRVGGFSEEREIITAEDYDLWLRLARENFRFAFLDEVLGTYRLHESNASSGIRRHALAVLAVVEKHYGALAQREQSDERRMRFRRADIHGRAAVAFFRGGDFAEGVAAACDALRSDPLALLRILGSRGGKR